VRKQIRNGIDPLEEKHARKAFQEAQARKQKTFRECAEAVLEIKATELKNKACGTVAFYAGNLCLPVHW
jgi:hypothetical protein